MPQPHEQDLFETSTMTFGEHLEELRGCLIKAILWLVAGSCIGLYFGDYVVNLIKSPLQGSLGSYYLENARNKFDEFSTERKAAGLPVIYEEAQVKHLIDDEGYLFQIEYVYPPELFGNLQAQYPGLTDPERLPTKPRKDLPEGFERPIHTETIENPDDPENPTVNKTLLLTDHDLVPIFFWKKVGDDSRVSIKALASQEAFMIWLKAGVVAGVMIASPMIFYHLWAFIAAGLYPHERKYINVFLPFSVVLFLTGAAFCFKFVLPMVLQFLFDFNRSLGIDPDPRITEWLSFALFLPIGFGLSFQLPLVMLFLHRVGIFSIEVYLQKWRIAVLVIAVLSMILTPADPMSMLMMGVPLVVLYFFGIALCRWMPKTASPLDA